ncbi:MAG: efflux RND transporter periplasmic adaptor subunit, partial [Bacteroidota bacterium]|nr:efflux RND transporter periplasmic adaptor subunit [Bacteroidota bacterium]
MIACKPGDKKTELEKLRAKQDEIAAQIEQLEKETGVKDTNAVKPVDVVVDTVKYAEFRHYIDIQGHIEGEQNIEV